MSDDSSDDKFMDEIRTFLCKERLDINFRRVEKLNAFCCQIREYDPLEKKCSTAIGIDMGIHRAWEKAKTKLAVAVANGEWLKDTMGDIFR